ncbi:MAG: hypothetical protein IJH34_15785, partial [Romboutsia sp.]|nr:hypothetical protein [Romboutsia sp.]
MKIFESKGLLQKIIITLVILIICNFIFPCYSQATFGGKLIEPVKDLAAGIGDAFINLLQNVMLPGSPRAVSEVSMSNIYAKYKESHPGEYSSINQLATKFDSVAGSIIMKIPIIRNLLDEDYYSLTVVPLIVYSPAAIFSNLVPA